MKVYANGLRVVGKNHRTGENDKGPWELFELECGNGEGGTVTLNCSADVYDKAEAFVPYTAEIDLYMRGYRVGGELVEVYVE